MRTSPTTAFAILLSITLSAARGEELIVPLTTQPATTTVSTLPTTAQVELTVSPDAQAILDRAVRAYAGVRSLELAGTASGQFDIDGQTREHRAAFKAIYRAPDKF